MNVSVRPDSLTPSEAAKWVAYLQATAKVEMRTSGGEPGAVRASPTRAEAILLLRESAASDLLDAFERLLWWLFAGSVGAATRAQVLKAIKEEPRNAQQLSEAIGVDYTTIRHHLNVLLQNRIVVTQGETYGKLYFVSDTMEEHWAALEAILEKTRRRRAR